MKVHRPLTLALLAAALGGCALEPYLVVDSSGAGQSQIGRLVARDVFLNERLLKLEVSDLFKREHAYDMEDPSQKLRDIGFSCTSPGSNQCAYFGVVKVKLVGTDGHSIPANRKVYDVKITADLSGPDVKIVVMMAVSTDANATD